MLAREVGTAPEGGRATTAVHTKVATVTIREGTGMEAAMAARDAERHLFLLGGYDLEMITIRELLQTHAPGCFRDKRLTWGAKASDYRDEIREALEHGLIPVLIELDNDLGLGAEVISVDHHGPRSGVGTPSSLHQVFSLLGLASELWTRRMELVAANDRGYIKGMLDVGASRDELLEIRRADRNAQGITEVEEQQAAAAVLVAEQYCDGALTVVSLPHNRTSVVADRLSHELGGPGYRNLFVVSPGEVNFMGEGRAVMQLNDAFPGGWYGGNLPESGYWGRISSPEAILTFLVENLHD